MDGMFGDFFETPEEGASRDTQNTPTRVTASGASGNGGKTQGARWSRPPPEPRSENSGFVGLLNQGTTCYLNSLLQTLHMTHAFRRRIFELSDAELGTEVLDQLDLEQEAEEAKAPAADPKGEGQNGASASESNAAPKDEFRDDPLYESVIEALKEAGYPQFHIDASIRACDGVLADREALFMWLLDNPTPDNAEELQAQYEAQHAPPEPAAQSDADPSSSSPSPSSSSSSSSSGSVAPKQKYRRIPIRLRQLFARLQLADRSAVSTQQLTLSFGWKGNHLGVQHDITELNRVLMDAIHRSLAGTSDSVLVTDLFEGVFVNKLSLIISSLPFFPSSSKHQCAEMESHQNTD